MDTEMTPLAIRQDVWLSSWGPVQVVYCEWCLEDVLQSFVGMSFLVV